MPALPLSSAVISPCEFASQQRYGIRMDCQPSMEVQSQVPSLTAHWGVRHVQPSFTVQLHSWVYVMDSQLCFACIVSYSVWRGFTRDPTIPIRKLSHQRRQTLALLVTNQLRSRHLAHIVDSTAQYDATQSDRRVAMVMGIESRVGERLITIDILKSKTFRSHFCINLPVAPTFLRKR